MTNLQKHLAFYNKDGDLKFDEEPHIYTNEENEVYDSVTQFLGSYEEEFNGEFWGMYTALKDNGKKVVPDLKANAIIVDGKHSPLKSLMKDSIYQHWYTATRAQWKGTNAEAIHRGNNTHNYLEDTVNQSKGFYKGDKTDNDSLRPKGYKRKPMETVADLDATDLEEKFPSIYNRLKMFIDKDCAIYAEKKLRLDFAKLAGTIDLPIIKRGTKRFCILDWKTNKDEFKPTSGYMKKIFVGGKWIKSDIFVQTDDRFKYPISHLPLCKINGYALQLSLYAYMMEVWGYELVDKGLEIIHIRPGAEPKVIKLPYLKDEVEILLRHRLQLLGRPFFDKDDMGSNFKLENI